MSQVLPYCFVLMPFGVKSDATGATIHFDRIYSDLIEPAIAKAELTPIRADREVAGGIIHKPMFERLVLCEYAVADLTMANANVFYELGVRHAVRPWSTVLLHAGTARMPFDVAMLRVLTYQLSNEGLPDRIESDRDLLFGWLREVRDSRGKTGSITDSPLFQLLEGFPDAYRMDRIAHAKTDIFRDQVAYAESIKTALATARDLARKDPAQGRKAIEDARHGLGRIADCETGVIIDLFLSYRAVQAWTDMIALVGEMPRELQETVMVREQLGLALNRDNQGEEAERVLTSLIRSRGPSSETYGILGRVYKDRWEAAVKQGDPILAEGLLDQAIDAYRRGFEADWRDAYPRPGGPTTGITPRSWSCPSSPATSVRPGEPWRRPGR
jgi:hypothetical protein